MGIDAALLAYDMLELATATWKKLDTGDRQGLRFREDSITDHNLWSLSTTHPGLHVHRFDQHAEKATGADWEWWVGSDQQGWLCLRIQAKRVDVRSYRQLAHPGERDDEFQYDTLLRVCAAETYATHALHVFYNGWDDGRYGAPWPPALASLFCGPACHLAGCAHVRSSADDFGCAVVATSLVKALHESGPRLNRLVRTYLPFSLPWHLLFGLWDDLEDADPRMEAWLPANSDPVGWASNHLLDYLEPLLQQLSKAEAANDFFGLVAEPGEPAGVRPRHPALPDYASAVRYHDREPLSETQLSLPSAGIVMVLDAGLENQ